uniref:RING-type domain-containing protein n=1 Tax=viral metagenome TaxID=1070528 RepID=A0A6C0K244_9ZZZZ
MENEDFSEFNNIVRLLLNDIITNEVYFPVFPRSPSQRALQASLYERNPIRCVITDEVKSTLTPIKFRDAKDIENNLKCSILCDSFKEDDDIIQLPCNHCFFVDPIMKWLTEDGCECPVCRYKFDSMEKNVRETTEEETIEENNENYNNYEYDQIEQINNNVFFNFINGNVLGNQFSNNIISSNQSISNVEIYPINFDIVEDLSNNDLD